MTHGPTAVPNFSGTSLEFRVVLRNMKHLKGHLHRPARLRATLTVVRATASIHTDFSSFP